MSLSAKGKHFYWKNKKMPISVKDKIRLGRTGKKHSFETREKISKALSGRKQSVETVAKRIANRKKAVMKPGWVSPLLGKKLSNEHKINMRIAREKFLRFVGQPKHSVETRKKISESLKGEKSPNWKGGLSKILYPMEFNRSLKLRIRTRDNFTCCKCGKTENEELEELNRVLSVNHINFNKNDCSEQNLNTLCLRCNIQINYNREYWTNYFSTKHE